MEGYRTIIVALLTVVVGVLAQMGVAIPEGIVEEFAGAIIAVIGAVFTLLRLVTDGPVGDLVRRVLGK